MLAPVAVEIDRNLQRLRDGSPRDVMAELELELDRPAMFLDRDARTELVLRQALRHVDLHGWTAAITDDATRLRLGGGSVSIDLGLSAAIIDLHPGRGAHAGRARRDGCMTHILSCSSHEIPDATGDGHRRTASIGHPDQRDPRPVAG